MIKFANVKWVKWVNPLAVCSAVLLSELSAAFLVARKPMQEPFSPTDREPWQLLTVLASMATPTFLSIFRTAKWTSIRVTKHAHLTLLRTMTTWTQCHWDSAFLGPAIYTTAPLFSMLCAQNLSGFCRSCGYKKLCCCQRIGNRGEGRREASNLPVTLLFSIMTLTVQVLIFFN